MTEDKSNKYKNATELLGQIHSAKNPRVIDSSGRVVVPKKLITDVLKIRTDLSETVDFFYTDNAVILKRTNSSCFFCDNIFGLKEYGGVYICNECIDKIKKL